MINKIIPVVFRELLDSYIAAQDIEKYEGLSTGEVMSRVFDELSEE